MSMENVAYLWNRILKHVLINDPTEFNSLHDKHGGAGVSARGCCANHFSLWVLWLPRYICRVVIGDSGGFMKCVMNLKSAIHSLGTRTLDGHQHHGLTLFSNEPWNGWQWSNSVNNFNLTNEVRLNDQCQVVLYFFWHLQAPADGWLGRDVGEGGE